MAGGSVDVIDALYTLAGTHTLPEERGGSIRVPAPLAVAEYAMDIIPSAEADAVAADSVNATQRMTQAYREYLDVVRGCRPGRNG